MKAKKHFLVSIIIAGVLCVPALGQVELPPRSDRPFLIGRPHPALAGIDKLHIAILPSGTEPNKDGLVWTELEAKVAGKLNEAGIKLASGITGGVLNNSELRVHIDVLELAGSQQYVFRIQTLLSRAVYLAEKREIAPSSESEQILKANVWMTGPTMKVVSVQDVPAAVTAAVLRQVGYFIDSYLAARPLARQPSDSEARENDSLTVPERQAKPDAKLAVAGYRYVASRRSDIFHRPECRWAKNISPENLVGYSNKAEATESGKRPCRSCKP